MRIAAALLVGLVLFVGWRLGVLGVAVAMWWLAPLPMTVLYGAAACGLAACCAYPRDRPGVVWTDVVMIRNPRPRPVPAGWISGSATTWTGCTTSGNGRHS